MAWFNKDKKPLKPHGETHVQTEGLWVKCDGCKQILWKRDLESNLLCCPKCGYHFKLGARPRLEMFFDDGKFTEHDSALASNDPLKFKDTKSYSERLHKAAKATGLKDALLTGEGRLSGRHVIISAMEFQFIGGSMGAVVGEMITRAIDRAIAQRVPLIVVSCSGGARMMEGAISLMQLAKISAGLARLDEVRAPYISVLTNPTTGGVTASYAMLGDLNIAEPGALIGFAGPRVIEQTIHKKLPEGFQTSEFLLTHGMLDAIVPRPELKDYLARVLGFLVHDKN
ncbi:MAG TPA: acetyl-CoA carboxylase, carboxyltransferase subunit beta [Terriglobia bacterium]|nr:acetyl-CoA carboxylase, carboxyltransferase subunit beta [Terriglobia bacterium]